MEKEVKELRIKIDGLAQLAKNLKPSTFPIALDLVSIPEGWDIEKWKYLYKEEGIAYIDSFNGGKGITVINPPQEILKTVDSLLLAKAWLGKVLEELGATNPYKAGYKTVEDIKPTADVQEFRKEGIDYEFIAKEGEALYWKDLSHIEKVDWLREEIKNVLLDFQNIELNDLDNKISSYIMNNVRTHLSEARFWLGFELARIKEENDENKN